MSGGGYEIATSVSSANPATSRAGEGDFIVTGGGNKLVQQVVIGACILGALWLLAKLFKK